MGMRTETNLARNGSNILAGLLADPNWLKTYLAYTSNGNVTWDGLKTIDQSEFLTDMAEIAMNALFALQHRIDDMPKSIPDYLKRAPEMPQK